MAISESYRPSIGEFHHPPAPADGRTTTPPPSICRQRSSRDTMATQLTTFLRLSIDKICRGPSTSRVLQTCTFLNLPAELRVIIYRFMLASVSISMPQPLHQRTLDRRLGRCPGLLKPPRGLHQFINIIRICHQIHDEILVHPYHYLHFRYVLAPINLNIISITPKYWRDFDYVKNDLFPYIRNLDIDVEWESEDDTGDDWFPGYADTLYDQLIEFPSLRIITLRWRSQSLQPANTIDHLHLDINARPANWSSFERLLAFNKLQVERPEVHVMVQRAQNPCDKDLWGQIQPPFAWHWDLNFDDYVPLDAWMLQIWGGFMANADRKYHFPCSMPEVPDE